MPSVFTMIMDGDLPASFVHRDDRCSVFMAKDPLADGHALVVPREEVDHWIDLDDDVMAHLEASRLVICDISGGNPNVFLELGVAMKAGKRIVLISQDSESPFDVRDCRWIEYSHTLDGWRKVHGQIALAVDQMKEDESVGD